MPREPIPSATWDAVKAVAAPSFFATSVMDAIAPEPAPVTAATRRILSSKSENTAVAADRGATRERPTVSRF